MRRGAFLVAALAALCLPALGGAAAHHLMGGLHSEIRGIKPQIEGLAFRIVPQTEELELTNETGGQVIMLGYEGEPYLRSDSRGVYVNVNSSATYLNRARYMGRSTKVPRFARPGAVPNWRKLSPGSTVAWHDHRIHWPVPTPPPAVVKHPDQPRRLFPWTVEGTSAGKPFAVQGVLLYRPSRVDRGLTWMLAGGLTLLAGIGAVLWFWQVRGIR